MGQLQAIKADVVIELVLEPYERRGCGSTSTIRPMPLGRPDEPVAARRDVRPGSAEHLLAHPLPDLVEEVGGVERRGQRARPAWRIGPGAVAMTRLRPSGFGAPGPDVGPSGFGV